MPALTTTPLTTRTFAQLQAVFGDCLPKQNAGAMLEASPVAPTSPVELQALRALVLEYAGRKLAEFAPATAPTSTSGRALPRGVALHMNSVQAARELRSPDGLLKVLTEKKAAAVFNDVAAMKDIPFGFLEEGCLHRSHVVCKRLEDAGIFTEKIFTIPTAGDLVMESAKAKLGFSVCWYHEAVVIHMQTNDGIERRVIDPSVGDKPLKVEEWLATMHPSPVTPNGDVVPPDQAGHLETFFLPRFAYGLTDRNEPPTAWKPKDLESALQWNTDWKIVQKDYEDGGFYDQLPKLAGR